MAIVKVQISIAIARLR